MKDKFYTYIENLQDTICATLEKVDGKSSFQEDLWQRKEGGSFHLQHRSFLVLECERRPF